MATQAGAEVFLKKIGPITGMLARPGEVAEVLVDVFGLPLVVDGLDQEDGQWRRHQVQDRPGNNVVSPTVDRGNGVQQGEDDPDNPAQEGPQPWSSGAEG